MSYWVLAYSGRPPWMSRPFAVTCQSLWVNPPRKSKSAHGVAAIAASIAAASSSGVPGGADGVSGVVAAGDADGDAVPSGRGVADPVPETGVADTPGDPPPVAAGSAGGRAVPRGASPRGARRPSQVRYGSTAPDAASAAARAPAAATTLRRDTERPAGGTVAGAGISAPRATALPCSSA